MQVTGNSSFVNKRLSIRITTGGFSFSVDGNVRNVAVPQAELVSKLRTAIKEYVALNGAKAGAELMFDGPTTLVPLNEFRSDELQGLFRLTFGENAIPQGGSLRYEVLSAMEVVVLYLVDTEVEQLVADFFPELKVQSLQARELVRGLEVEHQLPLGKRRMHVSIQGERLLLFTYIDDHLAYVNTFQADETSTQVYYTLYVWKHLELTQERDILVVHEATDEYMKTIRQFITDIKCE